jgi:hypothetical protein
MCDHEEVTIHFTLVACATRYEPAEYEEWAVCNECGEGGHPDDFPDADATDFEKVSRTRGTPHEFYD